MSYPEKGAHYRNKPAWMDRVVADEKRAQGGPVSIGRAGYQDDRSVGNGTADVAAVASGAAEDAKDDLGNAMRAHRKDEFWDGGVRIPGKQKALNDRSPPVRRASGGKVEPLIDSKGRTLDNPGNEFITNEPPARLVEPSSPRAAADAREQAAGRTRRTRSMPE